MIKFIALQRFLSFLSLRRKPYFTRLRTHKLKAVYMEFEAVSSRKRIRRNIQSLLSTDFCLNLVLHSILWVTELASQKTCDHTSQTRMSQYTQRVHQSIITMVCVNKNMQGQKKPPTHKDNIFFSLFPKKENK